jgi:septin family protein
MKITREQLQSIVKEVMQEESDYQDYFKAMLSKHGVKSPAEFKSDEERKDFFNKVEAGWDGVNERIKEIRTEQAKRVEALKLKEAEEAERLQKEAEEKAQQLKELNDKIDSAIETLEALRPAVQEEVPPMQQSEVPFQEYKKKK